MKLWRCAAAVGTLRYGALAYCLLLLEFLAFVPQGSWGETLALCVTSRNWGSPANVSGLAPKKSLLKLAACPKFLAAPSGGHSLMLGGGEP